MTDIKQHPYQQVFEFVAGCLGGFTQVLLGQPFDIVKVRLQSQAEGSKVYTSMFDCIGKIWKNEGPLAFYKGTLPPLIGVGACVSIQFGVLESVKRFLQSLQPAHQKELTMDKIFFAGMAAGLANSIVSIPAEHLRIRMQIQKNVPKPTLSATATTTGGLSGQATAGKVAASTEVYYTGSIDAAKKIYSAYGIRGIFKGTNITLMREVFTYGLYFWTYELIIRSILKPGQDKKELGPLTLMGAGAVAGYAYWLIGFPLDLLKTKIQTDSFTNSRYKSIMDCVSQTYKAGGFGGFYRGLLPCMLRAGPVNAGCFLVYEYSMRLFTKKRDQMKVKGKIKEREDLIL